MQKEHSKWNFLNNKVEQYVRAQKSINRFVFQRSLKIHIRFEPVWFFHKRVPNPDCIAEKIHFVLH